MDLTNRCAMIRSSKGFTLIELVAVLAVVGIMLFMALPRFSLFSQTDNIKGTARWICTTVPKLKSEALINQKPYALVADFETNAFYIVHDADNDTEQKPPAPVVFQLSDNIAITDVEYPGKSPVQSGQAEILFYPRGYSDRVIIHLSDADSNSMSLLIEPFLPRVFSTGAYEDFQTIHSAAGLN